MKKEIARTQVYANDYIIAYDDGTYYWLANSSDSQSFATAAELIDYAVENEPQVSDQIAEFIKK